MFNVTFSRARWIGAFSLSMLAACGSGQTNPKSSDTTDTTASTQSTAKTDATTAPTNTTPPPDKKAEVAGQAPAKGGSGSNEVAGDKPYQVSLIEIERPPFVYTLKTAVKVEAGPAPTLTKVSEKKSNITNALEWFQKNQLSLPGRMPLNGALGYPTPPERGVDRWGDDKLHYVLDHGNHYVLMYGANFAETKELSVFDKGQPPRGIYDFPSFVKPPEGVAGERQFPNMEMT